MSSHYSNRRYKDNKFKKHHGRFERSRSHSYDKYRDYNYSYNNTSSWYNTSYNHNNNIKDSDKPFYTLFKTLSDNSRINPEFLSEKELLSCSSEKFFSQLHSIVYDDKKNSEKKILLETKIENLKKRSNYELMYEAFYIANLFYMMNLTDWHSSDRNFYVVSNKWFEKWKYYVKFDLIMSNIDNYLDLNYIDQSENEVSEIINVNSNRENNTMSNFLNSLDDSVKSEIQNYFDSVFLSDNAKNYPGIIDNKELIYSKNVHYTDFNNPKSHLNYNVVENCQNGEDYILVTEPIWNYLKSLYGGKEIMRNTLGKCSDNQILVETHLKSINLSVFNKKDLTFPEPKLIFVSRSTTLYKFKKYLIDIFPFLNDCHSKDVRLWLLSPSTSFENFSSFMKDHFENLKNSNFEFEESIPFPGYCLELMNDEHLIGELDEMLHNKNLILEYKNGRERNNKLPNFIFKKQHNDNRYSDLLIVNKFLNKNKFDNSVIPSYNFITIIDTLSFSISNGVDTTNLFKIKNFFANKYGINNLSEFIKKENMKREFWLYEFEKEIKSLRENMHLIIDKKELMKNFVNIYSNSQNNYSSALNTSSNENTSFAFRQDEISRNRERQKILQKSYNASSAKKKLKIDENDVKFETGKEEPIENINNDDQETFIKNILEKCNYCSKTLDDEDLYEEIFDCENCNKTKYCSMNCKNKDARFHSKKCVKSEL